MSVKWGAVFLRAAGGLLLAVLTGQTGAAQSLPGAGANPETGQSTARAQDASSRPAGSTQAAGRVTSLAVDPANPSIVYLGAADGGIWKSADGGRTWTAALNGQPGVSMGAITIDSSAASCAGGSCQTIYAATGEQNPAGDDYSGGGILKSTLGGAPGSWTQLGMPGTVRSENPAVTSFTGPFEGIAAGAYISDLAVNPKNPAVLLAAVQIYVRGDGGASSGLYCSEDSGATWVQVLSGAAGTAVVYGQDGTEAYAALGAFSGSAQNGVYRSLAAARNCAGQGWTRIASFPAAPGDVGRIVLSLAPSPAGASEILYAAVANAGDDSSTLHGLYKTTDGGRAWDSLTSGLAGAAGPIAICGSQCLYNMAVKAHPANAEIVLAGGAPLQDADGNIHSLSISEDGGKTWAPAGAGTSSVLEADQAALAFSPQALPAGGALYAGNAGGARGRSASKSSAPGEASNSITISSAVAPVGANDAGSLVMLTANAGSPPTLTGIMPATGQTGSSVPVTLSGTNFVAPLTVDTPSGIAPTSVMVVDSMTATATLVISASATQGANPIAVTDAGGTSSAVTFNVTLGPPTLTSISPSSGAQGGSVFVTLSGQNFINGTTINVPAGITVSNPSVVNVTTMTATLVISGTAGLGAQNITVNNGVGTSGTVAFTVLAAPTLTGISPSSGTAGTSISTVTLTGTNFVMGSPFTISFSGTGITPNNAAVASSTTITAAFVISAGATVGQQNVTVTQNGATTAAVVFTVNPPPPVITAISPVGGTLGSSSIMVTLTGAGFDKTNGVTINTPSGVTVAGVTVASATSITATFAISSSAATGSQNITVTQPSGTSGPVPFGVGTDFTITAGATSPNPLIAGGTATAVLTITPMASGAPFPTTMTYVCTNLPTLSGCGFNPPAVSPSQGSAPSTSVTVFFFTTAPTMVGPQPGPGGNRPNGWAPLPLAGLAALVLLLGWAKNLRSSRSLGLAWRYAAAAVVIVALAGFAGACGSSNNIGPTLVGGTPVGSYSITVTATSGNASRTTKFSVTVKH